MTPKQKRSGITVQVVYRGGSEMWYEVRARGSAKRYPGYFAIHDIMRDVYND